MTTSRKWSAIAVVLVVAIAAAGWFLLIAPKRSEAADLRTKATNQDRANVALEAKLAQLQAQQADLPKQRALLAEMGTRIPSNPALPSLVRSLTAAGRQTGVDVKSMAPAVPVAVTAGAVAGVPVAPAPTTAGTAPAQTLYQVPLTLEVQGGYFALEQFLNKLEGQQRSLLVSGFTITPVEAEGVAPGTLTITINGRVFVSPETAATTTGSAVAPVATTPTAG